jgi:hypothetical protein
VLDFVFDLAGVLEAGEAIDDFALTMSAEGAALGLAIDTGARAPMTIEGDRAVQLWFGVAPAMQGDAAFAGDGIAVGIELRATTTASPPRIRERTFALTVRQR